MEANGELHIPYRFATSIHCTGGWMDSRTGLDIMEKIKIFCNESNNNNNNNSNGYI
jgi:hypothetical protein